MVGHADQGIVRRQIMLDFISAHIPQLFIAMCTTFGIVTLYVTIEDATSRLRRARAN